MDLDGLEGRLVILDKYYQGLISSAIKKADYKEAERLSWEAFSKNVKNKSYAKFTPEPNKNTGLTVYKDGKESYYEIMFHNDENVIYNGAKQSWKKGQIDWFEITKLKNGINSNNKRIKEIDKTISTLRADREKIISDYEEINKSISCPANVSPKGKFATSDAIT